MLHEQLKNEISEAMDTFEAAEKKITKETSLLLGELRGLVKHSNTALQLMHYIKKRLEKVPYKIFGFLPGVNDIRRMLEKILKHPDYKLKNLLVEENSDIRQENINLKKEINLLKEAIRKSNPEQTQELEKLYLHAKSLETKLTEKSQANSLLEKENQYLTQQMDVVKKEKDQLTVNLKTAQQNENAISQKYESLLDENGRLLLEVETLKKKIQLTCPQILVNQEEKDKGFWEYFYKR